MKTAKEKYLESALKYAQATKALFDNQTPIDEHKKLQKTANLAAKKCYDIFDDLRKSNKISELEDLMLHEDPHVRCLAASCCLYSDNIKAERVLEELIELKAGEVSMHALNSLKPWRNIPWTEDRYKQGVVYQKRGCPFC